eukprot:CAMPEP_0115674464 /NCGR_PEP_ID=MMETSP0272-20121206/53637_1 /TAXON_ID=71861 /ORGANISM="Scrippsiella trochoidea, Strain CCMP3099" /LENGTH=75 /DNA_ID=CAMNT_0003113379 /DNA_START=806 /DNA_END=1033 /DNA_ORIENTATION=+
MAGLIFGAAAAGVTEAPDEPATTELPADRVFDLPFLTGLLPLLAACSRALLASALVLAMAGFARATRTVQHGAMI